MPGFRALHRRFFWGGVALAAWGLVVASFWLMFVFLGPGFIGLSPGQIAEYDLRPFPVGGGLQGQLRFWWCLPAAGALVWLLALVALGTAPWIAKSKGGSGSLPKRRHWVTWLVCAVAAGTGGMALCGLHCGLVYRPRVFPMASLSGVERLAGPEFPEAIRLVEARGYGGWYGALRATVVMPKAATRPFLRAPPFESEPSSSEAPDWADWYPFPSMPNWTPADVEEFLAATGGRWTGADIITWSALADMGDPQTTTVHLEWTRG